jgi:hypothetical protein
MYSLIIPEIICMIPAYLALKYSANSILQDIGPHLKNNVGTPLGSCKLRGVFLII